MDRVRAAVREVILRLDHYHAVYGVSLHAFVRSVSTELAVGMLDSTETRFTRSYNRSLLEPISAAAMDRP